MELAHDLQRIAEEIRFAGERLEQLEPANPDAIHAHRLQMVRDHLNHAGRIAARLKTEAARLAASAATSEAA